MEQQIYETAGEKFNLASPKQLGDILFDKLKIGGAKQKKTKTGQYATGEEVLSYLANEHQIVRDILEWRQMVKLQSTYIDALPNQVDKKTGRVHTDYMQTVAATGRLMAANTPVAAIDRNGKTATGSVNASGQYSIDWSGLTFPVLLKATENGVSLYSVVVNSTEASGKININQLTHMAVVGLLGDGTPAEIESLFKAADPGKLRKVFKTPEAATSEAIYST